MFFRLLDEDRRFVLAKGEIVDNRVMLCDYGRELRDDAELGTFELVDEMVEFSVHLLLLVLLTMDAELQLASHTAFEEEVDKDVIVLQEHPVLYLDYPQETAVELLQLIKDS